MTNQATPQVLTSHGIREFSASTQGAAILDGLTTLAARRYVAQEHMKDVLAAFEKSKHELSSFSRELMRNHLKHLHLAIEELFDAFPKENEHGA